MNRTILLKIIIPLLFALAVILGLIQSTTDNSFVFERKNSTRIASDDSLKEFYDRSLELGQKNQTKNEVSFLAVGDVMLSRNVSAKIKSSGDPLLPFSSMTEVFKGVDFSVGNLESPFSGSDYIPPTGSLVFNAPDKNISGLTENKFKVMSLANNHALDQGVDGLQRTMEFLDEHGIKHTGAGMSLADAWQPAVVDEKGIKICFLAASYTSINDGGKTRNDYVARIDDLETLKAKTYQLKAICDFIAVHMHAGTEYTRQPNQAQIDFARAAIDAGADLVIGHHPHWIQTIEKYKDKYIFYSLGNFIFDQMWSQETREGLALKIKLSKPSSCHPGSNEGEAVGLSGIHLSTHIRTGNIDSGYLPSANSGMTCGDVLQGPKLPTTLESVELIPIIIDNYSTPRVANEQETKNILKKINIESPVLK